MGTVFAEMFTLTDLMYVDYSDEESISDKKYEKPIFWDFYLKKNNFKSDWWTCVFIRNTAHNNKEL